MGGATRFSSRKNSLAINFNPRSPWGERLQDTVSPDIVRQFQSTLPVGGATIKPCDQIRSKVDFNPRSPWGERLSHFTAVCGIRKFQSTLPVGGATITIHADGTQRRFQSTLPVGGATGQETDVSFNVNISIHAPRGGSDRFSSRKNSLAINFNPRSPWGERQQRCTVLPAYLWRKGKF